MTQRYKSSEKEKLFKFQDTSFEFLPDALPQKSGAIVVVLWYKTMHSFLKDKGYFAKISTNIITASVRPEPDPRKKFSTPVRIIWTIKRLVIHCYAFLTKSEVLFTK